MRAAGDPGMGEGGGGTALDLTGVDSQVRHSSHPGQAVTAERVVFWGVGQGLGQENQGTMQVWDVGEEGGELRGGTSGAREVTVPERLTTNEGSFF